VQGCIFIPMRGWLPSAQRLIWRHPCIRLAPYSVIKSGCICLVFAPFRILYFWNVRILVQTYRNEKQDILLASSFAHECRGTQLMSYTYHTHAHRGLQEKLVSCGAATARTSALNKLLSWHKDGVWQAAATDGREPGLLHQADWLASLLTGILLS
jgi:hypothetical protein